MGKQAAKSLALAIVAAAAAGCTNWQDGVPGFLESRAQDMLEMADIGVTVTTTPQVSVYAALLSVGPVGYGNVDGTFFGIGGGDIGAMKLQYRHIGLGIWGREEVGWGDGALWNFGEPDPDDPEKFNKQGVGPLGFVLPPYDARPGGRPT